MTRSWPSTCCPPATSQTVVPCSFDVTSASPRGPHSTCHSAFRSQGTWVVPPKLNVHRLGGCGTGRPPPDPGVQVLDSALWSQGAKHLVQPPAPPLAPLNRRAGMHPCGHTWHSNGEGKRGQAA